MGEKSSFSSVQFSRSVVSDSSRPHGPHTARQASLSITNSRSLLRLSSTESVMPSSHLLLGLLQTPVEKLSGRSQISIIKTSVPSLNTLFLSIKNKLGHTYCPAQGTIYHILQYPIMVFLGIPYNGQEPEKEYLCMYNESLCCTAETNTTL